MENSISGLQSLDGRSYGCQICVYTLERGPSHSLTPVVQPPSGEIPGEIPIAGGCGDW